MTHQQRLALVNTGQLFSAWREARNQSRGYAYGLRWKAVHGQRRLFRQRDRLGNGSVIDVGAEEAERLLHEFQQGKARAAQRLKAITAKVDEQARLNKALRVARAPEVVARICRALDGAGLAKDFVVIGTNALFAYEAEAGVLFFGELLASGDVDPLFDARKRLTLASKKLGGEGLAGLLRKADRSFRPLGKRNFRAVNDDGFMVDLVIPQRTKTERDDVSFGLEDLVAAEVPGLQWLVNSPKQQAVVVDEKGWPFPMRVPDPRAFALHKAWLSGQPTREPLKRPRDIEQARAVARAVREHLPQLPFELGDLSALHGDVRAAMGLL